jgi:tRNA threonylcarbamoyladenosine biosynthesis protein TsaE
MNDSCTIWLPEEEKTESAGKSLAASLYQLPLTILLSGELGAGKTTFIKGFASGLGISSPLSSPTFALEQRYRSPRCGVFRHIDLYRLNEEDSLMLLPSTEEDLGIRCIEWGERVPADRTQGARIDIRLQEAPRDAASLETAGRFLTVAFHDIPLPSSREIAAWRQEVFLSRPVAKHCDAVGKFARFLAERLLRKCVIVRPSALDIAGKVHDLLRFLDFHEGGALEPFHPTIAQERAWGLLKNRFGDLRHEEACAIFLRERKYHALAQMIEVHGILSPPCAGATIEQKVLFYADKRVLGVKVVSLEERFADFRVRYAGGALPEQNDRWYREAKAVESELFPEGPPFTDPHT